MRKYHLADALTALEIIMAATITGMIIFGGSANVVIWLFAVGELCDAFDGICARRWPYPDDGKFRWWRVPRTVQLIEHVPTSFCSSLAQSSSSFAPALSSASSP